MANKRLLFPALVALYSITSPVVSKIMINIVGGEAHPLDGFAAHDGFVAASQEVMAAKIKAASESILAHSKVGIGQLLPNINELEYTFLQLLHSLITPGALYTDQLVEVYLHLSSKNYGYVGEQALSPWLRSNMDYSSDTMYVVAKSLVNRERSGLMPIPQSIVDEISSLMNKSSVFDKASTRGDLDVMKWLLGSGAVVDLSSALETAWHQERMDIVKELVKSNANLNSISIVNAMNCDNETLLHIAAGAKSPRLVASLLRLGASVNSQDINGSSALYLAVRNGDKVGAKLLIEGGSDVNLETLSGNIALHEAIQNANHEIAELLLDSGSLVDKKNTIGLSPLMMTEKFVITGVAEYLLRNKVIIPDHNDTCSTYLLQCSLMERSITKEHVTDLKDIVKYSELAKQMIMQGEGSCIEENIKWKLLNITLTNFIGPLAQSLFNLGARLNGKINYTRSIFFNAIQRGNNEIVTAMLNEGMSVHVKANDGTSGLHVAANSGNKKIFFLLIQRGANVDSITSNGWGVLHAASKGGSSAIVEYLLKRGADVNRTDSENHTPLYVAALAGRRDAIRVLLDHGADLRRRSVLSTLAAAVLSGSVESVSLLIDRGADIEEETDHKETPLVVAAKGGQEEVFEALLNRGACVIAKDRHGDTVLHIAAKAGSVKIAELLLEMIDGKCSVNMENNHGKTPLELAIESGNRPILELLTRVEIGIVNCKCTSRN